MLLGLPGFLFLIVSLLFAISLIGVERVLALAGWYACVVRVCVLVCGFGLFCLLFCVW